jgi:pyruvate/2-oxoglutarate dehydrogenase complex dihydrolipoamide dehydrogenase (E3) component
LAEAAPALIIETGPQLMTREDPDVADEMQRILGDEGIQILGATETLNVKGRSGQEVSLTVRTPSGEQKIEGSDILAAAGRVANTAGVGLEEAGVELDAHGYIRVNERLETTAPNVWAIGECAGSPQFTHASEDDFRIGAGVGVFALGDAGKRRRTAIADFSSNTGSISRS